MQVISAFEAYLDVSRIIEYSNSTTLKPRLESGLREGRPCGSARIAKDHLPGGWHPRRRIFQRERTYLRLSKSKVVSWHPRRIQAQRKWKVKDPERRPSSLPSNPSHSLDPRGSLPRWTSAKIRQISSDTLTVKAARESVWTNKLTNLKQLIQPPRAAPNHGKRVFILRSTWR